MNVFTHKEYPHKIISFIELHCEKLKILDKYKFSIYLTNLVLCFNAIMSREQFS